MNILFTGVSSFTGSWFASSLIAAGHQITATFRGSLESYSGVRRARVEKVLPNIEPVWGVDFGDDRFGELVSTRRFDLFCHHSSEMANYRSWEFDPLEATRKNTRNVRGVLTNLAKRGCSRTIFTGTVFEPYEGVGDCSERAFNPYGLSKHLSFEIFRMEADRLKTRCDKFVIPNPFGPLEEARFTSYLMQEWMCDRVPVVATPLYVRDNIHISLLSLKYRSLCNEVNSSVGSIKANPSGYIESQGAFARRFASEVGSRLGRSLEIKLNSEQSFTEPLIRTNSQLIVHEFPSWSESAAWDDVVDYYERSFAAPR